MLEVMGPLRTLANRSAPPDAAQPIAASGQVDLRRLTLRFIAADTLRLQTRRAGQLFSFIWLSPARRTSSARVVQWVRLIEQDHDLRQAFELAWVHMLTSLDAVSLFAESGLPRHNALAAETLRRLFQRLLPSARHETDAGRLFIEIFTSQRSVERFVRHEGVAVDHMLRILWPANQPQLEQSVHRHLRQALCLLAVRLAGRGATEAIRQRGSSQQIDDSPLYRILFQTQSLVDAGSPAEQAEQASRWRALVFLCREELNQVHLHMEDAGVSSALVFDLRSIEATLDRMQLLVDAIAPEAPGPGHALLPPPGRNLLSALIRARYEDTRISSLFRQNLNLLARKTVERTGRGGEHYIAHTQGEYAAMWRAAAGGGLLTVFTAAIKMRVIEAHLPLFVEGLFISVDYAVSFVLLQILGLALATKQPSMTAATLAGIVRDNPGNSRYSKIAEFAADICRTQLAAAFGNVLTVCIGAVAFEALWARMFQTHYLPVESAQHVYQTLHPFTSGTVIFAAFTGVLLWVAALIGGWCENFVVYHRIPDAILQHPLSHKVSPRTITRTAQWIERNVAAWSTSISLGLLLGFSPVIARFFGIPLDVRHVTLSTGTLALAAARFGTSTFGHGWFYYAVAGIGLTFILNLGVSFTIASTVALRAYDIPWKEQLEIIKYVIRDFFQSPLEFIVPGKPDVITITAAPASEPASEKSHLEVLH